MKTKNFETGFDIFADYALTNEEMICVRGGNAGDPPPSIPPVKL